MNLVNILYEPYVIMIFISLIITVITYFIIKDDKKDDNIKKENNIPFTLLYTFIISYILLIIIKYLLNYMNKQKFFEKGGSIDTTDKLTFIDDDIDIGLIDD
jgi:uncharacterized membrane protein YwzB